MMMISCILTGSAFIRVDYTIAALESGGAGAFVRSVGVLASSAVPAGRGQRALVHVLVAQPAFPADGAFARKVQKVAGRRTLGPVPAPVGRARVQPALALGTGERQLAHALVRVDQVDARTAVLARVDGAIVHVHVAVVAGVAGLALARVPVDAVRAHAAVLTRVRAALVHVDLATFAGVARPTVTYELVEAVLAAQGVQRARVAGALVNVGQATGPVVAARALAPPTGHQVHATAAVGARAAGALVHVHLAVQTGEPGEAIARIPGVKQRTINQYCCMRKLMRAVV